MCIHVKGLLLLIWKTFCSLTAAPEILLINDYDICLMRCIYSFTVYNHTWTTSHNNVSHQYRHNDLRTYLCLRYRQFHTTHFILYKLKLWSWFYHHGGIWTWARGGWRNTEAHEWHVLALQRREQRATRVDPRHYSWGCPEGVRTITRPLEWAGTENDGRRGWEQISCQRDRSPHVHCWQPTDNNW